MNKLVEGQLCDGVVCEGKEQKTEKEKWGDRNSGKKGAGKKSVGGCTLGRTPPQRCAPNSRKEGNEQGTGGEETKQRQTIGRGKKNQERITNTSPAEVSISTNLVGPNISTIFSCFFPHRLRWPGHEAAFWYVLETSVLVRIMYAGAGVCVGKGCGKLM